MKHHSQQSGAFGMWAHLSHLPTSTPPTHTHLAGLRRPPALSLVLPRRAKGRRLFVLQRVGAGCGGQVRQHRRVHGRGHLRGHRRLLQGLPRACRPAFLHHRTIMQVRAPSLPQPPIPPATSSCTSCTPLPLSAPTIDPRRPVITPNTPTPHVHACLCVDNPSPLRFCRVRRRRGLHPDARGADRPAGRGT